MTHIEAMKYALEEMKICNYNSAAERLEQAITTEESSAVQEPVAWRVRRCDAPKYWTVFHHKPIAAFQDPEQEVQPLYAEPQFTQENNESIGFYSGRFNGHDLVSLTADIPIGSNLYTHPPVPQGHKPKAEQEPKREPDVIKWFDYESNGRIIQSYPEKDKNCCNHDCNQGRDCHHRK